MLADLDGYVHTFMVCQNTRTYFASAHTYVPTSVVKLVLRASNLYPVEFIKKKVDRFEGGVKDVCPYTFRL